MAVKKTDGITTIGRRKSAIARVRMNPKATVTAIKVNGRDFKDYFNYFEWQDTIVSPLTLVGLHGEIACKVSGGGIKSQAGAIRLAIARGLIKHDEELRATLKKAGYLTRDPRIKERKKPGLKKARRAPQWSKR